jgi:spermidine/putrescine transport system ATP-binding protein
MQGVAVELKSVTKRFEEVVAVDDISLQIMENEFFSLLGPSGCGKTTTLRMIGGFEHPTVGEVYIEGRLANNVAPHKRDTNMVFQQLALFPNMDVYDNIAFGLRMKKVPKTTIRDKVRRALDLVELSGLESRRTGQLSGGQQQRVAIARALINEPSVLLLDEPLGALDLKLRLQMQLELKELQHRVGTTFIYVTHDQGEALTMSDRLAVMKDGRIEQLGSCEEVYERPRTRFVASFIGDSNLLDGVVTELDHDVATMDHKGVTLVVERNEVVQEEGAPLSISLRPERINVNQNLEGCENRVTARVKNVTYKGGIIDYELVLPSEDTVIAQVQAGTGELFHEGDDVDVGWTKEACVAVRAG